MFFNPVAGRKFINQLLNESPAIYRSLNEFEKKVISLIITEESEDFFSGDPFSESDPNGSLSCVHDPVRRKFCQDDS